MVEVSHHWEDRQREFFRWFIPGVFFDRLCVRGRHLLIYQTLGGIPHDTYGMTSRSIRQYVLGMYKHLGLLEKNITKIQTGGPGK
jgi:hypothetical protein